jgi:hypothetical protein
MATAKEFFNIDNFRSNLNSGSRANLFKCFISGGPAVTDVADPGSILGNSGQFSFLCRSAAIPAYSLGIIEVPFRGRRIKIPGDRTYAEWTVTVLNTENQGMRKVFDNWLAFINNPDGTQALRTTPEDNYRCTIVIDHLKGDGSLSRKYSLIDAFPTDISPIDLSYDTTDAIQEFTVTFQYHFVQEGDTVTPTTPVTTP